jgi:ABC-type dipeptide/oligopeptide/nickel transport system permease component
LTADFPAVAGVRLVLGTVYVTLTAVVDVVFATIDPRIKLTWSKKITTRRWLA